jgi:hypothetical protein
MSHCTLPFIDVIELFFGSILSSVRTWWKYDPCSDASSLTKSIHERRGKKTTLDCHCTLSSSSIRNIRFSISIDASTLVPERLLIDFFSFKYRRRPMPFYHKYNYSSLKSNDSIQQQQQQQQPFLLLFECNMYVEWIRR